VALNKNAQDELADIFNRHQNEILFTENVTSELLTQNDIEKLNEQAVDKGYDSNDYVRTRFLRHLAKDRLPSLEQLLNDRLLTLQTGMATKVIVDAAGRNMPTTRKVTRAVPMNELTLEHFEPEKFEDWTIVWDDLTEPQIDILQQLEEGHTFNRKLSEAKTSQRPGNRPSRSSAESKAFTERYNALRIRTAGLVRMLGASNALWSIKNPHEAVKINLDNIVVVTSGADNGEKLTARDLFENLEEAGLAKGYDESVRALDVVTMHLLPEFGGLLSHQDEEVRKEAAGIVFDELRKFLTVKNR
jgi:hypothetical protein